jgi:hypothetical protein
VSYIASFISALTAPFRWLFGWPLRLIGAPRRLMSLELPMRVAVLLAIVLVVLTVTGFVAFIISDSAHWYERARPSYILIVLSLLVAIPIVVYHALRLWLEGDLARFPDIDEAWREGMVALQQNGLDLSQLPLFLILGAPDQRQADNLMRASGMSFIVESLPTGRAPLRWYANDTAIFLFTIGTGCLSRLNQVSTKEGERKASSDSRGAHQQPSISGTMVAGNAAIRDSSIDFAGSSDDESSIGQIGGTLVPGVQATAVPGRASAGSSVSPGSPLSRQERDMEIDRMHYLGQLLNRARQPLCPLNGMLTLLPLQSVRDILTAKDMPDAIRRDMAAVRDATRLSCSVTTLVTGMEGEPGFSELVRRVGTSRSKNSRFGKGFSVWNQPNSENLEALAGEACGAFEDWVYALFRDEGGIDEPGNGKLYALLCTIRSELRTRIRNILIRGFSCETPDGGNEAQPELFGGCYFAATGDTADQQAFVRSALDKLTQLEEELEWTDEALAEDRRCHQISQAALFFNGLLFVTLILLIAWAYFYSTD